MYQPSYQSTLSASVNQAKLLLASYDSPSWKLVPTSPPTFNNPTREILNGISPIESVQVHKRRGAMTVRGGHSNVDVLRATTEMSVSDGVDLDNFKAVLQTPELRSVCELP